MTIKEMQVPIVVVLKAMGMESDQEIVQMVGRDPKYAGILAPSLQECSALGIHTQQQALEYLGVKVRSSRGMWVKTKRSKVYPAVLQQEWAKPWIGIMCTFNYVC
jgi:DNA-directed RNA polymerase III subunit RPC2